jgi:hypothetical protein
MRVAICPILKWNARQCLMTLLLVAVVPSAPPGATAAFHQAGRSSLVVVGSERRRRHRVVVGTRTKRHIEGCFGIPIHSSGASTTLNGVPVDPSNTGAAPVVDSQEPFWKLSRVGFLNQASLWTTTVATTSTAAMIGVKAATAFEGGVGGLGKTKPETGCRLFEETSRPVQNERGIITAEIRTVTGNRPILVEFQTPWPLLSTSGGLEARDLTSSESAFVQVLPAPRGGDWRGNRKVFQHLLLDSVFASTGKFGAYGTPSDVRVKTNDVGADSGYTVTFTTLTPAMRESEREAYIKPQEVDGTLVLLVVGTTRARFPSHETTFQKVVSSFRAVAGPESNLRSSW